MEEHAKRDGKITVTKTVFGEEKVVEETIDIQAFETTPALVSVKAGATVNMGNYESGRIDILVSIPCYKEEVADLYPRVKDFVDTRMATEYQELKASVGK